MITCIASFISTWDFGFVCLLSIPVVVVALKLIAPIKINRIIVSKWFSYAVLAYAALALILVAFSTPSDAKQCNLPENSAWSHLFSPGCSISGKTDIIYYRLLDILGILIFNVLLITTLLNSLTRLREKWKEGKIYYNRALYGVKCNNDVIAILGNHESSFEIIKQCFARIDSKPDYVLVLIDSDVNEYRGRLLSTISRKDCKKVILCRGSLTSSLDLQNIHIEKATEVFILGNKIESSLDSSTHDAECIKCIRLLRDNGTGDKGIVTASSRPSKYPPLTCRVFFEYQTSYSVFQTADIGGEEARPIIGKKSNCVRVLIFKPMNFYEQSCEKVIATPEYNKDNYIPIDGIDGIDEKSEAFVHIIIVGQTKMGTALGIETAHLAHFPNFHRKEGGVRVGPRTRISFIDEHADLEMDYFKGRLKELFELSPWRYRDMSKEYTQAEWANPMDDESSPYFDGHIGKDFIDVEWEFIKGNIASQPIQEYLVKAVHEKNAKSTIAICFHDQNLSVAAAQYLPYDVCISAQEILVYQNREGSVIDEMVKYDLTGKFSNFRSFGTIGKFYDDGLCRKMEPYFDEELKYVDTSKPRTKSQIARWWSNRYRELTTWINLRSFGDDYDRVNIELFSKVEHSRWNMEQLLLGFRPLTKEEQVSILSIHSGSKDEENKLKQQAKDSLKSKKVHLDICSCERLHEVDPDVICYDTPYCQHIIKSKYIDSYKPKPINTNEIPLPDDILQLSEKLAEIVHKKWVEGRTEDGWKYGPKRNDKKKEHPCLIPYAALPDTEKEYDRNTSLETLKVLLSLGYSFILNEDNTSQCTSSTLPEDITHLSELLAKNVHKVWAQNRMKDGWRYGDKRDDVRKKHPCLVPYDFLSDSEKDYDRKTSRETLKLVETLGYKITLNV